MLFVSAPPDRLRRGIKAAKKELCGMNHAWQSTKTGGIPPSDFNPSGFTPCRDAATARLFMNEQGKQRGTVWK
jgi:hypothetical protein